MEALHYTRIPALTVEGMTEIETPHLAKFTVITVSGKNGQWLLKIVNESAVRNRIIASSSVTFP